MRLSISPTDPSSSPTPPGVFVLLGSRHLSHRPPLRFLTVVLLQNVLKTWQQSLSRFALSGLIQGGREFGHMSVLLQEVKWVTLVGAAAAAAGGGSGGTDTM